MVFDFWSTIFKLINARSRSRQSAAISETLNTNNSHGEVSKTYLRNQIRFSQFVRSSIDNPIITRISGIPIAPLVSLGSTIPSVAMTPRQFLPIVLCISLCTACSRVGPLPQVLPTPIPIAIASPQVKRMVESAIDQVNVTTSYDPAYVALPYPRGDVPMQTGVCTDVVIRAFRSVDLDLQQLVHEDMRQNFAAYPQDWGLTAPDANIDHRRVPNLMTFFDRRGKALPVTHQGADYQPGDIVAWDFGGGDWHIGIVSNYRSVLGTPMIVHNAGAGAQHEDVLFRWKILGHYRVIG
jgi:uncharacterized protein